MRTTKIRHARTNRKQLSISIFGKQIAVLDTDCREIKCISFGHNARIQQCPTDGLQARLGVTERQPLHKCVRSSLCKLKILQQLNSHAKQIIELYHIKSSHEISSYCCVCASHYSSSGSKSMTCVSPWACWSWLNRASGPNAHVQLTLSLPLVDTVRGDDFAGGQGYNYRQGDMPGWAGDRVLRLPCALGSVC